MSCDAQIGLPRNNLDNEQVPCLCPSEKDCVETGGVIGAVLSSRPVKNAARHFNINTQDSKHRINAGIFGPGNSAADL